MLSFGFFDQLLHFLEFTWSDARSRQHAHDQLLGAAMGMLLEHTGQSQAGGRVNDAIQIVTGTKMKSQAAGKMGYGTSEVGDLVVAALH